MKLSGVGVRRLLLARTDDDVDKSSVVNDALPDQVVAMGEFLHACEGEMVCKSTNEKIPYFNAFIYLENKTQIGKVPLLVLSIL